jgi:hypothetical protein
MFILFNKTSSYIVLMSDFLNFSLSSFFFYSYWTSTHQKSRINEKYDSIDWTQTKKKYNSSILVFNHKTNWTDIVLDFKDFTPQSISITWSIKH